MKKISISNIIKFKSKSTNSQITYINYLSAPKLKPSEGGDYWIHSLSAIANAFKTNQPNLIEEKTEKLQEKFSDAEAKISKEMFKRNIRILNNFNDFNFFKLKPNLKLNYLSKPKDKSILQIKGVPVQVLPHHVFTFEVKNVKKIGAVWFVAKLGGFEDEDLALFTDSLYRYLKFHYSKEFEIDENYCTAVDVITLKNLKYSKIANKTNASPLNSTLELIKKILK